MILLQVSLLFEVEDLAVASPATVSRSGMVYSDALDLGWQPYVNSWLQQRQDKVIYEMTVSYCHHSFVPQQLIEILQKLFDKFVAKVLEFKQKQCKELIPTSQLNSVVSLCKLFQTLATAENGVCCMYFIYLSIFEICCVTG